MRLGSAWLALSLLLFLELARAANILAVFPYRFPSPFKLVNPLMRALTQRGHKVTMITPVSMPSDIEGVRHIRVPMLDIQTQEILDSDLFMEFISSKWSESRLTSMSLYNISHAILSDSAVQQMLRNRSEKFDIITLETVHMDALFGLAEFYDAPLMGMSAVSINWAVDYFAGNPSPSVYEPISPAGYLWDNSLLSRWYNWIYITEEQLIETLIYRPAQLRLLKQFFGYPPEMLSDLRARFSVILMNTHFSLGRVRANVPNIIEVAGLHLSELPEPCDKELQRFLDEAEHGVIYFSMGMEIMVRFLPENLQQQLLDTFAQLEQRIVWKREMELPNKSDNIYTIHQSPQRQVLTHPNVKLFITNGGLLSIIEAVHSGVPMLGLPVFFDQFGNMRRMQKVGVAECLDINTMTVDSLTTTIRSMLVDPRYARKAKELSQCFKDRPMSPLETAVWWTEYALRHKNVSHMRMNIEEVPLMRYYSLDNLLMLSLRFGIMAVVMIFLGFMLFKILQDRQRLLH
ncbi:2-hydroxyacylsphingosine 1-beta-galactosyltransferase-like [Drosophila subobscura]|uniref:2-hydroxyacylsphingosine 1-beta-galactosyltransferase-like n=1 Tax=Drosophila subobscura TaxID=7241 RepID=UPI00155A4D7D|nr:2-hydroxyacylsphingosine 1-beta-galactosyltransferase-like [Drosophila subobscura]